MIPAYREIFGYNFEVSEDTNCALRQVYSARILVPLKNTASIKFRDSLPYKSEIRRSGQAARTFSKALKPGQ